MDSNEKTLNRRKFLLDAAAAGALLPISSLISSHFAFAQTPARSRVVVAHGVGVYSLNPYAVNTSPLQAVWQSILEPLIDVDYDKREYRGVLAESWQMKGNKIQFK